MNCAGKNWLKKQSLVFKISLSVVVCFFICIFILLGIVKRRSEAIITEQILAQANYAVQTSVNNISHLISETEQALRGLRHTLNQVPPDDVASIRIALNSTIQTIYSSGFNLSHVGVYASFPTKNAEGILYSAFAKDDDFTLRKESIKDFSKKFPWIAEIIKEGGISWSEPYYSHNSPDKDMVITGVLPFNFQGQKKFQSLVYISINIKDIRKYIENTPLHDIGHLILFSGKGLYINHPDPDINLKMTVYELSEAMNNPHLSDIAQKVLAGETGVRYLRNSSIFNEPVISFYAPVTGTDWGVCLIFSRKHLFRPIYELQFIIVISAISGIVIILLLINAVCRYSTRPLQNLARIALQYGKGNFSECIPEICSDDEISALATAFCTMRNDLSAYVQKERLTAIEQQKAASELEIARQIQCSVLPVNFPKHKLFDIYGLTFPSRQIGGDLYNFFFLNKRKIAFVIADVSGKGISAALFMMRVQEIIRQIAQYGKNIEQITERINNILCQGNTTCMFVTMFFAVFDLKTETMEYVNAGHLPPFLLTDSDCREMATKQNLALGVRENVLYKAERIKLKTGSTIFLYTDGITEAENRMQKFYGRKRLQKLLSEKQYLAKSVVENVMTDIKQFTAGMVQSDDITMLAFHYKGNSPHIITVEAEISYLPEILDFIEQDMEKNAIRQEIREKIIVIAEELFSNIASYSYKDGGKVSVSTALHQDCYILTFEDHGRPYDPLKFKEPDVRTPLNERKSGGLGIFLVKKMADSLKYVYKNGTNILKVSLSVKKPEK